jgi:hypothetical protein
MSELDDFIIQLNDLDKSLTSRVAKEALPGIQAVIEKSISAQTEVDGTPWEPRKAGKSKAGPLLKNADSHITYQSFGSLIAVTLSGTDVYHQKGYKSTPKRPILPDSGVGLPKPIAEVLTKAAKKVLSETLK